MLEDKGEIKPVTPRLHKQRKRVLEEAATNQKHIHVKHRRSWRAKSSQLILKLCKLRTGDPENPDLNLTMHANDSIEGFPKQFSSQPVKARPIVSAKSLVKSTLSRHFYYVYLRSSPESKIVVAAK